MQVYYHYFWIYFRLILVAACINLCAICTIWFALRSLQGRWRDGVLWSVTVMFLGMIWYVTFGFRTPSAAPFSLEVFRFLKTTARLLRAILNWVEHGERFSVLYYSLAMSEIDESILNVILFIPVGYLLPVLQRRHRWSISCGVACGLVFSFVIESVQLLTHMGTFDLGDLLHNTMGGALGGLIFCRVFQEFFTDNTKND